MMPFSTTHGALYRTLEACMPPMMHWGLPQDPLRQFMENLLLRPHGALAITP